jgi:hypothetical protein
MLTPSLFPIITETGFGCVHPNRREVKSGNRQAKAFPPWPAFFYLILISHRGSDTGADLFPLCGVKNARNTAGIPCAFFLAARKNLSLDYHCLYGRSV